MDKDIDLRKLGNIMGLPLYINVAGVSDYKGENDILSERDRKVIQASMILKRAFEMSEPTDKEVERFKKLDD